MGCQFGIAELSAIAFQGDAVSEAPARVLECC
jgi:hypothetical protein